MSYSWNLNKNEIINYPTNESKKEWEKVLNKKDVNKDDIINWHKVYTPWFDDATIKNLSDEEYNNLINFKKQ